ncbi:unnamed protein product [Caenorhabditis brenneri]
MSSTAKSPSAKSPATDSISQAPIEESGKTWGYSTKYLIIFSAATVLVITAVALTLFFVLQARGAPEKLSRQGEEPNLPGATSQAPIVPGGTEDPKISTTVSGAAEDPTGFPGGAKDSETFPIPPEATEAPTTLPVLPGSTEAPEELSSLPDVAETFITSSEATEAPTTSLVLPSSTEAPEELSTLPEATETPTTLPILPGSTEAPEGRMTSFEATTEPSETSTTLPEPTDAPKMSTILPPTSSDPDELIYAQTLFRHGARAPDRKLSRELKNLFPKGKGKLTERGANNSFLLGKFFRKRYVKSGFLNENVDKKQMKWLSRDVSRCIKTARYVARGMFRTKKKKDVNADIIAPKSDGLLNFQKSRCHIIDAYKYQLCPQLFNRTRLEDEEHKMDILHDCIGTNNSIFSQLKIKPSESDTFINVHRNGFQNPKEIEENYEEICEEFLKLRNLYNGIGDWRVIRTKFGHLMNKLLTDLQTAWDQYEEGRLDVKFRVYSTQDWVISGILEAFNLLTHIQSKEPREEPGYNTMILMELWKRDDEPFVKFYFKPEEVTEKDHKLQDLTDLVPKCQGSKDCPLENFTRCCDWTRIDEETLNEECYPDLGDGKTQKNKER